MTCWSVRGSGVDLAAEVKRPTRRSDRQTQGAEFARQPVSFAGRRRWRRAARLVTADGAAQDSIPDDAVLSVDGPREWPVRFPSDVHVSSFESVYSLMFTPSKTYGINRVRRESFLGR